jgi:hypothetical protein
MRVVVATTAGIGQFALPPAVHRDAAHPRAAQYQRIAADVLLVNQVFIWAPTGLRRAP